MGAQLVPPLDDRHVEAGLCEIARGGEAVDAAADYHDVELALDGLRHFSNPPCNAGDPSRDFASEGSPRPAEETPQEIGSSERSPFLPRMRTARTIKGEVYNVTLKVLHCNIPGVSAPAKKSVVRSIRITQELDDLIRKDATDRGLTVNALISSILAKYAEWDRYADRFGFVTITRDGFRSFIEAIEDDRLVEIAEELGARNPREMTLFWFKRLSLRTFLRYLSIYSRYGRIGEYEVEAAGGSHTITLHHDLGRKYSLLLARFLKRALETIAKVSPQLSVGENALAIRFTSP